MTLLNQDFEFWAGEDVIVFVVIEGLVNLSGIHKALWRLLETPDSPDGAVEKYWCNDDVSDDLTRDFDNNRFILRLRNDDTRELGGSRYFHEFRIWDGYNNETTVLTGRIKINPTTYQTMSDLQTCPPGGE